ncbi:MAG: apolipoprotein N-acyltransferase [bacterium]|nr:apolipoprotein N-acyltransferase [bacterium]
MSALLAISGGALWSLCFGRQPSVWLPWVALTPLILLLGRRRAVLWGWLFAFCLWLGSMYWIAGTLQTFGGLTPALALVAQVLLALYLGFDQVVFVFLGRRIWRRGVWISLWALPALWVAIEWLRGVAFGRFPWNLAAYAWADVPGALPLTAWVGSFGVSWLLVFANVCVAVAWRRRRWEAAATGVLLALLVLIVAGRWSDGEAVRSPGAGREVRVIQPNSTIVHTWEESWDNYRRLIAMSDAECDGRVPAGERRLLVWPESAAWPHSYGTSERLRDDLARLTERGCDVLLGSQIDEGEKYFNSVLLVSKEGPVGNYSKRKLVPWGEYVPLKDVLPFMGRVARAAGDFTPGRSTALLPWRDERLAAAICYEVIFGGAVAEQVRDGATVLVTVTNDAWYGDTTAPHQHFRAARFRAAENRRPLIRAALTGISGLIDRRGDVTGRLGVGERGVLRGRITGARSLSPYSRAPWLVPLACAVLAVLGVGWSWRRG